MTLSEAAIKYRYEGNGSTDTFAFNGKAFSANDLVVEIITRATDALEETLTITTDYTVTINVNGTASIQTVAGKIPSATQDIQIRRDLEQKQETALPTGTVFPAQSVENAIDRSIGIAQEQEEQITRSLKFPVTSSTTVATLPEPVDNSYLLFDGTTGAFKVGGTAANIENAEANATAAAASASAASTSASDAANSAASNNIASPTASKHGALLYQNDADDGYDALTDQGASGQVLTSSGADAAPSWQDASGGAWNLITSQTASSSSSIDFTSGIDGTYDTYKVIISDLNPQSFVDFWMLASTDGGSTFLASSNYAYQLHYIANGTESVASYSQSANQIELVKSLSSSSVSAAGVEITIYSPSSSQHTAIHSSATYTNSGGNHAFSTCGARVKTTSAVNALRFKMSVNNLDTGTFKLYGVS